MENKKNELGNFYGCRMSKNGNWLNVTIVTHIDGHETFITCPVRVRNTTEGKPYARVEDGKAIIFNLRVYEDAKKEEQPQAQPIADDDIPF